MYSCCLQNIIIAMAIVCNLTLGQIGFDDLDTVLRNELQSEFDSDRDLIASVVRLIFHDCAGQREDVLTPIARNSVCDGCIELDDKHNTGIEELAIDPLEDIYNDSPNQWQSRMNRADFWAAAATIAVQYAHALSNSGDALPNIPFFIGRESCSTSPDAEVNSGRYHLPYKTFPNENGGWLANFAWFRDNFGFNAQQTVAIIGAHTLGRMHSAFSGHGSGRGTPWVGGSDELTHDFYRDLVRRDWTQQVNEQGFYDWIRDNNARRVFLNSDIALLKDVDTNLQSDGRVNCLFSQCASNRDQTVVDFVLSYAGDNQLWLIDFASAFIDMITMGYTVGENNFILLQSDDQLSPVQQNTVDPTTSTTTTSTTSEPTRRTRRGNRENP
mmetsp:Transcript_55931/g.93159  ORF Transcript_55931/g.93159 Transcript_55931/m.93159 type:complete len:384 (+) Transcript_55931:52-1203(+)